MEVLPPLTWNEIRKPDRIIEKVFPGFPSSLQEEPALLYVANLTFTMAEGVSRETFLAVAQTWLYNLPAIVDAGAFAAWTLADHLTVLCKIIKKEMTPKIQI